jgi:hypothetical protein
MRRDTWACQLSYFVDGTNYVESFKYVQALDFVADDRVTLLASMYFPGSF